jgi:SSS family solute:Na+ symporter
VAGRTLTLPAFVATLVATWYGGILGVGEFAYTSGLATWTVFGLPYYVYAVVYALFLAHRVRGAARLTIPDTLEAAVRAAVRAAGRAVRVPVGDARPVRPDAGHAAAGRLRRDHCPPP